MRVSFYQRPMQHNMLTHPVRFTYTKNKAAVDLEAAIHTFTAFLRSTICNPPALTITLPVEPTAGDEHAPRHSTRAHPCLLHHRPAPYTGSIHHNATERKPAQTSGYQDLFPSHIIYPL